MTQDTDASIQTFLDALYDDPDNALQRVRQRNPDNALQRVRDYKARIEAGDEVGGYGGRPFLSIISTSALLAWQYSDCFYVPIPSSRDRGTASVAAYCMLDPKCLCWVSTPTDDSPGSIADALEFSRGMNRIVLVTDNTTLSEQGISCVRECFTIENFTALENALCALR